MSEIRNLVIIGSGPSAWTAAIYAARAKLEPLVIAGEQSGGQLMWTTEVENYPGFPTGILGPELMAAMRKQVERLGVEIIDKDATLLTGDRTNNKLWVVGYGSGVSSAGESMVSAKAVIIATGASAITLKLPGEDRLMGRGVGTCAVCDAPFYKDKETVFVVGGGDSAIEESLALSKYAKNVILLVRRDQMRASAVMQDRIKMSKNIKIWYKSEAREFIGDQQLQKVKVLKDGQEQVYPADGFFYAIGHSPTTGWLKGSGVALDEKGYVVTPLSAVMSNKTIEDRNKLDDRELKMEGGGGKSKIENRKAGADKSILNPLPSTPTPYLPSSTVSSKYDLPSKYVFPTTTSLPGVFAAGDCVDMRYRQAITAAGYGCMAALDAQKWLEEDGLMG